MQERQTVTREQVLGEFCRQSSTGGRFLTTVCVRDAITARCHGKMLKGAAGERFREPGGPVPDAANRASKNTAAPARLASPDTPDSNATIRSREAWAG